MKKFLLFSLLAIMTLFTVAQKKLPLNLFLHGQGSIIAYDVFKQFSGGGAGIGFQSCLKSKNKLKPQIDACINLFSINKILILFENGEKTGAKGVVGSIMGGLVYEPINRAELAFAAGPAFHIDGVDLGVKPYVAYYTGKNKVLKVHASLTHIWGQHKYYNKNTGIISAGLAIKLF